MADMWDRRKAAEAKFAFDAEERVRVRARRNSLVAVWAAGLIGRADARAYAQDVVAADVAAGDDSLVQKISGDLKAAGVAVSEQEIRGKMLEFMAQAATQIQQE